MDVNQMLRIIERMQADVRPLNIHLAYDDGTTLVVTEIDPEYHWAKVDYVPLGDPGFDWTYGEVDMTYPIDHVQILRSIRGLKTTVYLGVEPTYGP